jgi:hypothetical protein
MPHFTLLQQISQSSSTARGNNQQLLLLFNSHLFMCQLNHTMAGIKPAQQKYHKDTHQHNKLCTFLTTLKQRPKVSTTRQVTQQVCTVAAQFVSEVLEK